jgi:hypothetical protein
MLTVKQIEALRFGEWSERVPDGNGLYLRVFQVRKQNIPDADERQRQVEVDHNWFLS